MSVPDNIRSLERPHPDLLKYYIITAIFTGPGIIATLPYLFFRYHTLRYRFDDEGIHMKVGILCWLGLANVQIQPASGSSGPDLVIEGFKEFEAIRDFLYPRMRGYQTHSGSGQSAGPSQAPGSAASA